MAVLSFVLLPSFDFAYAPQLLGMFFGDLSGSLSASCVLKYNRSHSFWMSGSYLLSVLQSIFWFLSIFLQTLYKNLAKFHFPEQI